MKIGREALDIIGTARAVVSQLDLEKALTIALKKAMEITRTKAGSIALYDAATNTMRISAHRGLSRAFLAKSEWNVRPGGLTEKIIKNKKVTIISNIANHPLFANTSLIREKIKSLVCVPLIHSHAIVGILYLDDFTPRGFSKTEIKALEILASFASIAIHHARTHNHVKQEAVTDALTGLFNRRCFEDIMGRELQRAKRHERELSLALIDVDDFKKYNDTYGHQAGDEALAALGEAIRRAIRSTDIAARYGGDEIAIILPETRLSKAYNLFAERIKREIEDGFLHVTEKKFPLTVTIGIASFPQDGRSAKELVLAADKALLSAKKKKTKCSIGCSRRVRSKATPSPLHTAPGVD